jgi:polysaccharide biosynthesis protein PelF
VISVAAIKVCILLEGSYPYITGGVSAWVQDMIQGIPEIDFVLFSISPEADQELRYELPSNVVEHKDIVLTEAHETINKPKNVNQSLKVVEEIHHSMFAETTPDIIKLIHAIPEGYFMHKDAVRSNTGWEMITEANQLRNPLYPFTDYFWAWKSGHEMIFTVLGASPPEADIYHAVSTGFAGLAALAAKIRHGKPFLLTEHGLYHKEREMEIRKSTFIRGYQRDMWINIYNELSFVCYKNADRITALFEENRRKQIDLGASTHNTYVTPNGIDIERFTSVKKEKRDGFHVGLVGRVVPIKDIKTFISTAKIVLDQVEDAVFHCIGPTDEDQGYYEDCKLLVESLKISESFHFLGRQNVLEYYSFIDVMLLTSVREAQPLVILEAYAAQVPVVSTTVGNVPEMLDYDDRFLAASKDSEKLAQGILYIHDNPEIMKEIIAKNLDKVKNFYDKLDLHKTYLNMYKEMAEKGE